MVDLVPQYRLGDGPGAGEAFRTAEEQSRKYRLQREAEDRAAATARANEQIARQQLAQRQQRAAQNAAIAREELKLKRMQEQRAALDSAARREVAKGTLGVAQSAEARAEKARQDLNLYRQRQLDLQAARDRANIDRINATTEREKKEAARREAEIKRLEDANSRALQQSAANLEKLYKSTEGLGVQPQQQPSVTRPGSGVSDTDVRIPVERTTPTQPGAQQPQRPNNLMSGVLARIEAGLRAPPPQNYRSPAQPQQPADFSIQQLIPGTQPQLGAPQPPAAPSGVPAQPTVGTQVRGDSYSTPGTVEQTRPGVPPEEMYTEAELFLRGLSQDSELRRRLSNIQTGLATGKYGAAAGPLSQLASRVSGLFGPSAGQARRNIKARQEASDALSWFQKRSTQKLFATRRDLLDEAEADPTAFYKKYKNVKPKDIPAVAAPAGVSLQGAAPPSQATPADQLAFGKITPEAITRAINPENPSAPVAEAIRNTYSARSVKSVKPVDRTALIGNDNRASYEENQIRRAAEYHYNNAKTEMERQNAAKIYDPALYANDIIKLEELKNQYRALRNNRDLERFRLSNGGVYQGVERILSEKAGARIEIRQDVETQLFDVWYNGVLTRSRVEPQVLYKEVRADIDSNFRAAQLKVAEKEAEHQRNLDRDEKKGKMELRKAGLTAQAKLYEKEGYTYYRTPQENTIMLKRTRVVNGRNVDEFKVFVKKRDKMGVERWVEEMRQTTAPGRSTGGVPME